MIDVLGDSAMSANHRGAVHIVNSSLPVRSLARDSRENVTDESCGGQSQEPGPDDSHDDGPLHTAEAFHRTHPHNRGGNHMGGREWNSKVAGNLNNYSSSRLSSEAMDRLEFY